MVLVYQGLLFHSQEILWISLLNKLSTIMPNHTVALLASVEIVLRTTDGASQDILEPKYVEVIEMIEMTSKEIDMTVKDVEQGTFFIEPSERDKLLPLRELEGLDKQLRTIKGSLKVAIGKRVDLESRIEHEERKLNEIQDPTYSDDQRNMI